MKHRPAHFSSLLAAAILAAAVGNSCLADNAPDSRPTQDQILAHIDSLHVSRQVEAARAYIEPHLRQARAAGDSTFILPLVAKLGRLWAAFGEPRQGEPLLREAAVLAEVQQDSLSLCDALRWLGFSVEQQGRSTEAVVIYRKQLEISRLRGDRRHEAWAMVGLAYRAGQEGRYENAVTDYRLAADIFQDLENPSAVVWTLNGMGAALQQNGQFQEAAACYGEVAALAQEIGYVAVQALALNNRASMEFSLGDPGVALEHFRQAGKLQRQISQNQDAVSSGTNEAVSLYHLGRLDEAAALLEKLLAECERGNFVDRGAYVLQTLADVRRSQGRQHEAAAIFRRILARDDEILDLRSRIEAMTGLGTTLADLDSSTVALHILQEEENRRRGQLKGKLRLDFELCLADRLQELDRHEEALKKYHYVADAAEEAGLQGRRVMGLAGAGRCRRIVGHQTAALALLRKAARVWEDTRSVPGDPEWREQRGSTGRLVYAPLAALILGGQNPDPARIREAFDTVQAFKARTLAERMGGGIASAEWPIMTLERLQEEILQEGEVFLDAYLGPTESLLWVISRTESQVIHLPEEESLTRRFRLYHELLATRPPSGPAAQKVVEAAGRGLGTILFGQAAARIAGSERVIFAPDGALNLVPLVTVTMPEETGLVWMRVPSASILGYLRTKAGSNQIRGQGVLAAAASETPQGQPLPGAAQEVRHLARRFQSVDLWLAGSTAATLVPADLQPYDILHLATHARADDQRPWSSEIVLDARDPAGRLLAGEIAALDLTARLAVLSACETGSGRILSGEGVLGLSSAFLGAGVPTVVASLWPVDDTVTTVLMERFYAELSGGRDTATALARAQKYVRADAATAHPFHWAGFVVVGEGTVSVDLGINRRPGPLAGFFIAAGMIIVLIVFVRKRLRPQKA